MVMVAATDGLFLASTAMGQFLLCLSKPGLKGEKNVKTCSAAGDKFAIVDKNGLVRILTKEEMDMTMAFNPKIGQLPAFGMEHGGEGPQNTAHADYR
jgi:hypothetical protein